MKLLGAIKKYAWGEASGREPDARATLVASESVAEVVVARAVAP